MHQSLILLGREIILNQCFSLDCACNRLLPGRMPDETFRANPAIAQSLWNGDSHLALLVLCVPILECLAARRTVSAHVRNLDPDRPRIGRGRLPRPFFEIER